MTPRAPLLAFLLVLGSAATEAAEAPTGWTEVQTAHVTLRTDLRLQDARRAALAVERTRAALLVAAWPGLQLMQPERIDVVVLSNHQDFEGYFGGRIGGLFVDRVYPPTAYLYGAPESWEHRETLALEETTSVLKHELTHHLAAYVYRRQPKWFSEGLAQFLETMRLSPDGKTATLGDINLQALRLYNTHRTLTVADALAWGGKLNAQDEATTWGLYGLSWLLVHWLYNTHPEEFARYQTLLVKGIDPDKAYKATFSGLGDVDAQLQQFAHYGEYRNVSVELPEVAGTLKERPMTSAEVHATRAEMALSASVALGDAEGQRAKALADLASALAEDPTNVRALRMKVSLVPPAERVALGRRATASHPEDGLAWLLLAQTLPDTPQTLEERSLALKKATQLLPDNPEAFYALAWLTLRAGHAEAVLPLALAAARMAPWNSAYLYTLALALAAVGRCSEAVNTQALAVELLPERSTPAARAEYTARLASFAKTCGQPNAAPATPSAQTAPAPRP